MKFLLIIIAIFCLGSCTDKTTECWKQPAQTNKIQNYGNHIQDYGNYVYYFEYTEEKFGIALSKFRSEHPKLRIISIAPNDFVSYGYTTGYFVVCDTIKEN